MSPKFRIAILAVFILLTTLLHNMSSMEGPLFLNIYQRLYYIPIVLAAYWFGLRGAIITSLISTLSYPHHGHYHWPDQPFYTMNQYAEMLMFNLIAVVTGILSDLETRQRKKYEETASELKEAYQQLRDSFEQVRMADRLSALGELSAGMAHEIRNPLGSIKGGIDIIEEGIEKDSKKYEFIQIIKKEIARLDALISEFLTYARPKPPHKSENSINDVVHSVVTLIQKEAHRQKVKITLDLTEFPHIMMDSEQIKQALLNILLNGLQAMPGGGSVTIKSGVEEEMVILSVSDTGPGISEEEKNRLFDPFYTTKDKGTGLGLSIAFQIIKAHGGTLEAGKITEGGAEFIIKLPMNEVKDEA